MVEGVAMEAGGDQTLQVLGAMVWSSDFIPRAVRNPERMLSNRAAYWLPRGE